MNPVEAALARRIGEKAMQETLRKSTFDALMSVTPDRIRTANHEAEIVKGSAYDSCCWLHGPAMLQMLSVSFNRLVGLSGRKETLERVDAKLIEGTKVITLHPAPKGDMRALPINRYEAQPGGWVNLITLLAEAGLTIESGYSERFDVNYIPEGSPLFPGLVIDLGAPLERKRRRRGSQEEETDQQQKDQAKANAKSTGKKTRRGRKDKSGTEPTGSTQAAAAPGAPVAEGTSPAAAPAAEAPVVKAPETAS